jgi:hypothetical protein
MKNIFLILILAAACIQAQWSNDPNINNPICTSNGSQVEPVICSDGSGGAIIAWGDHRTAILTVYAQRIDSSGVIQWPIDGLLVCSDTEVSTDARIVSDGSGGAIIVWVDFRNGFPNYDIYAQRINSNGNFLWNRDGVPVCQASEYQIHPEIASDGNGGAVIAWIDHRGLYLDIYTQRINANGEVQWTTNGVLVSSAQNFKANHAITCDGNKGALITWFDQYSGYDILAQRIDSSGTILWSSTGTLVCDGSIQTLEPVSQIISDRTGGAIICWSDSRNNLSDIYAQRISSGGTVQWQTNGIPICTSTGEQYGSSIVEDDSGGAIIAWVDSRFPEGGIFAQRINSFGVLKWSLNGVWVFSNNIIQDIPAMCSDGAGGAIIAISDLWHSYPEGNIYAQRINPSGELLWLEDGVNVSTAPDIQFYPALVIDGNQGAIITWMDNRSYNYDIYVSRVDKDGNLGGFIPVELVSFNTDVNDGCVTLTWLTATETNNKGFEIERNKSVERKKQIEWENIGYINGSGTTSSPNSYSFIDKYPLPGSSRYRVKQIDYDGSFRYSDEVTVEVNNQLQFPLFQNYPNPFNPSTKINYSVSQTSQVQIKVFDVLGTEIETLVNEEKPSGTYEVTWYAENLPSGVYFYQIRTGSFVETKKMVLMK